MQRLMCDAILFDLDGVLVDSTASIERHWSVWAQRHGLDVQEILAVGHGRQTVDTIRLVAPALSALEEARALEKLAAEDTEGLVTNPGAHALFTSLPSDRRAVVTSGTRLLALARLQAAGLPIPRVLVCAADVARGKPHPEGYLQAARLLGMEPERCIVVEDAPVGIQAGHAAGMRVIALATTHAPESLREAEVCVPSLERVRASLVEDVGNGPALEITIVE